MLDDAPRQQFYADLASKWTVEDAVNDAGAMCEALCLKGHRLVALPHPLKLCAPLLALRVLDLSCNKLCDTSSLAPPAFPMLEELNLNNNAIKAVARGSLAVLPRLKSLSMRSNGLLVWQDLTGLCANLDLRDNPVIESEAFITAVLAACGGIVQGPELGL